jgi:hypothetical protein
MVYNISENHAVIKIQSVYRLYKCKKSLYIFNNINLKYYATNLTFEQYKKIIINKNVINDTQLFINTLSNYKKGLTIKPQILISAYLIKYFTDELLGNDKHPFDYQLINLAELVINSFDNNNIYDIWNLLKDFNILFINWSKMDKNRTIEQLITSYYYRNEHINKIKNENIDETQKNDMIQELEKQKNNITTSIKLIDKTFDIKYLEQNYDILYNSIQNAWNNTQNNVVNIMKKAYYNMLCDDIINDNMMSIYKLLKEIGNRLLIICPDKYKKSFLNKFCDDYLYNIVNQRKFNYILNEFIEFIVDVILLMDAPINDINNNIWKNNIINTINNNNFTYDFPKILIEIEEHIDIIFNLIKNISN